MSKYDILTTVAEKVQALGNDVKLKILALLIEEGSKSITDISKELNINFSTAHKYLEQLESAGLVSSKQVSENRMKRMFTIKDFDLALSPAGISEMLKGETAKKQNGKALKVLNEKGELVDFEERIFSQKYLKRGMPRGTIVAALSAVLEQAYDGITLLEMRMLLRRELEKKVTNISEVFKNIEEDEKHKRTYGHILSITHPEALDMHARGDIFIKNLREPRLLTFVHDLRALAVHGSSGKKISGLQDFFSELIAVMKKIQPFTSIQALDAFNFCAALFAKNLSDREIADKLRDFFDGLAKAKLKVFLSVDLGMPRYSTLSVDYLEDEAKTFADYLPAAQKISEEVVKYFKANAKQFDLIVKIWPKADLKALDGLEGIYVANMAPAWQSINASYAGPHSRFDSDWKHWMSTQRSGELQSITLNLARLASHTKSEQAFFEGLKGLLNNVLEYIYNMSELSMGEFFRKHDTYLESVRQRRWHYVQIENCSFSIALAGLSEAASQLAEKKHSEEFIEKTLKLCNSHLRQKVTIPIRVPLKLECDDAIIRRFAHLEQNKAQASADNTAQTLALQKYLPGGHCSKISKSKLKDALNKDCGLVFIEK